MVSGSSDETVRVWNLQTGYPRDFFNYCDGNGWARDINHNKLFWVPSHHQKYLCGLQTVQIMSSYKMCKVNSTNFVYGTDWVECKTNSPTLPEDLDLPISNSSEISAMMAKSHLSKWKLEADSSSHARKADFPDSSEPTATSMPVRKKLKIGSDTFSVPELEISTQELNTKLEPGKARIVANANSRVELVKANKDLLEKKK
ncbi:hypothetical protein BDQ17DRAFT_1361576 [Cyathus striatus]|nr:hypothetical protein BDQ17DRAFT_1361576 [Cyathus striatus]